MHTHVRAHRHTLKNIFKKKKKENSHFEGLQNGQNSKYHHTLNGNPQKRIRHRKNGEGECPKARAAFICDPRLGRLGTQSRVQ